MCDTGDLERSYLIALLSAESHGKAVPALASSSVYKHEVLGWDKPEKKRRRRKRKFQAAAAAAALADDDSWDQIVEVVVPAKRARRATRPRTGCPIGGPALAPIRDASRHGSQHASSSASSSSSSADADSSDSSAKGEGDSAATAAASNDTDDLDSAGDVDIDSDKDSAARDDVDPDALLPAARARVRCAHVAEPFGLCRLTPRRDIDGKSCAYQMTCTHPMHVWVQQITFAQCERQ